jgi:F-type H+-transporting ATPase subunit epsilon
MQLKLLLPSEVLLDNINVLRIVAETNAGSFGILPHRLDCVAALVPGILTYEEKENIPVSLAVDEGVLVKGQIKLTKPAGPCLRSSCDRRK